jgi:hypothetical protein
MLSVGAFQYSAHFQVVWASPQRTINEKRFKLIDTRQTMYE